MELLKYIYALKPGHKYFSKDFDGEDEWRSDGSYSSEDSEFEAQFADVVKDLPPNLASKLPKRKVREYDEDDDDDEEESKQEEIVQRKTKKSIVHENTFTTQHDSNQNGNERILQQKVALLEKQIEMLQMQKPKLSHKDKRKANKVL